MHATFSKIAVTWAALFALVSSAEAGLVSHWSMDAGTGQTVADTTSANDGVRGSTAAAQSNDPTWTAAGQVGPFGLDFDGSDVVSVPNSASLDVGPQISISTWVRRNPSTNREIFYTKGDGTSTATTTFWLEFQSSTSRLRHLLTYDNLGTPTQSNLFGPNITDSNWHHYAATYDGSTHTLFVDGVPVDTNSISGDVNPSAFQLSIGALVPTSLALNGTMDDTALWNDALTPPEVRALVSLATEFQLGYNASEAQQLFDVANGLLSEVVIDGATWRGASGALPGLPGELTQLPEGFILNLGGGIGVSSIVPEPSSVLLLSAGLAMLGRRRRRR